MSFIYSHACSITCVSSGNSCCHGNHVIDCVYFMNFHIPLVQLILKQYYRVDPSSTGSKGAGLQDYILRTSRFHSSTNLSYGSYIFGRRDITYTYYPAQYAVQRVKCLVPVHLSIRLWPTKTPEKDFLIVYASSRHIEKSHRRMSGYLRVADAVHCIHNSSAFYSLFRIVHHFSVSPFIIVI